jgi:hypothetical protein
MSQLHECRGRNLTSAASLQLVEAAEQSGTRHQEVSGEGIREPLGFRWLASVADERYLSAVSRDQEVRVFVGKSPTTTFGWMTGIQGDAPA